MYLFDQFSEEGEEAGVGHLCGAVPSCSQQRPQTGKKGLLNINMLTPGLQGKQDALIQALSSHAQRAQHAVGKRQEKRSGDTSGNPHNLKVTNSGIYWKYSRKSLIRTRWDQRVFG